MPNFALLCQLFNLRTAEVVLPKMDEMEKVHRCQILNLEDVEVRSNPEANTPLFCHFCLSRVFHLGK